MSGAELIDWLGQRRSTPARLLGPPGPSAAELERWLDRAVRVPDHGKLTPWRFLLIDGDARDRLGAALAALQTRRGAEPATIEKDRQRFSFAPTVVAVIACLTPGHKIPEREQLLSAGCVCYQLLLCAQAAGYGAQWLTGWAAYDPEICALLGLSEHESIVGFVHIGTAREEVPDRPLPLARERLTRWSPP